MAITGNTSLNRVQQTPTNFEVYFNLSAESTSNLVSYEIFLDNISQGTTSIVPATKQTGIIEKVVFVSNIGFHTFGVLFADSSGGSEYFTQTIYLDRTTPVLNDFRLLKTVRDENDDFQLDFAISLQDETGISRVKLINTTTTGEEEKFIPQGTTTYTDTLTLTLSSLLKNSYQDIVLEYEDFSGNIGTSAPINVHLSSILPQILNSYITNIEKTDDGYWFTIAIKVAMQTFQHITDYSINFHDVDYSWNPIYVSGTLVTFEKRAFIAKDSSTDQRRIFVAVRDNYGNPSNYFRIPFQLDIESPEGSLHLDYAKKIGLNYYANVKFNATDSGNVKGYGYQLDDYNSLNWKYPNTLSQILETSETINLGTDGDRTVYAQYMDYYGNLSEIYELKLNIDTVAPDCNFKFIEGIEVANNDHIAKFELLAIDNTEVQFIKLYGYNANTNALVPGHTNNWIRITETKLFNEIRELLIPNTENEELLRFNFQAIDLYGNESPLRTLDIKFDKTKPVINTFVLYETEKTTSYRRFFMETEAVDNHNIVAYKKTFGDIQRSEWIEIEPTLIFNDRIWLDISNTELNQRKDFKFQVKDIFGNISNTATFPIDTDGIGPTGNASFSGASLNATNYVLDFNLDAQDGGTNDVYFYSITANDPSLKSWKRLKNPGSTISEIASFEFPRTNDGKHVFYIRYADVFKNESPVYTVEYDLDSIAIVGGLELSSIIKDSYTYYANVHIYAFDNRRVDSYSLNGGADVKIEPPVNSFDDYLVLPIGGSPGPRSYRIRYKDTFGNVSPLYEIEFDLDRQEPSANLFVDNVTTIDSSHYDITLRLDTIDREVSGYSGKSDLLKYKFWYTRDGEPSSWTDIPRGFTEYDIIETFTIDKSVDVFPEFQWKIRDFFQNELYDSAVRPVITLPPYLKVWHIANVEYTTQATTIYVNFEAEAALTSMVNYLHVKVNETAPLVKLDEFDYDVQNANLVSGVIQYTFPKNITYAKLDAYPVSDYGYFGSTRTSQLNFDSAGPNTTAEFVGSFEDNYDYILQFHVTAEDFDSGLNYIEITVTSFPLDRTFRFTVQDTNTIDGIYNVRIDQTHPTNSADIEVRAYDLMNNSSSPIIIPNILIDRLKPAITNYKLNNNLKYNSAIVGTNQLNVPIQFHADDISQITHYKYSKHANVIFDDTWTEVPGEQLSFTTTDTVSLSELEFEQGEQTFYIHARDKFNNIGTAGINFELDTEPPIFDLTFPNYIEREVIGGVENFKIPYVLDYLDNYSKVWYKHTKYEYGGNEYNVTSIPYGYLANNVVTDYYYIPIGDYGDTKISVALQDRLLNTANYRDFSVVLETTPPVINNGLINRGDRYTTNKEVYVQLDATDNIGITQVLFSKENDETWDSPGWIDIPFGPRKDIINSFTVNLETLGFVEGDCTIKMYVKDMCQNVTRFSNTILYDKTAPTISNFYINNISRTLDTFEIESVLETYDDNSGIRQYYISESELNKQFTNIPGSPIYSNTPHVITQTDIITKKDGGEKTFYAQVKDSAGNVTAKANVKFFIDNESPFVAYLDSAVSSSLYYLNAANNTFKYIVSDNYSISTINYKIDGQPSNLLNSFTSAAAITHDTQTFNADFSSLLDGEHILYLIAEDHFKNKIQVPYVFNLDRTAPFITKFEIKKIKPSFNGLANNYDVEFDIEANDFYHIVRYELYDNDVLVISETLDNRYLTESPTIISTIGGGLNTEKHKYELKVYDKSGNLTQSVISKEIHNGIDTLVNNFTVNGGATLATNVVGNLIFGADLESDVNIEQYALTIQSDINYDDAYWRDFLAPANTISFSEIETLNKFAVNTLTGISKIYLHVKDDCGNIANNFIDVFLTNNAPTISNVTSPINLVKKGSYYIGEIQFQINDPDSLIEAYAVGFSINPSNFKSIAKTSSTTIKHQIKIHENEIVNSKIIYIQLRDAEGNLSTNYRASAIALDFKFDKFEIEMNKYVVGVDTARVYFETDSDPLDVSYGYQFDTNLEPVGWHSIGVLNRNTEGDFYFDFNIDTTSLVTGEHVLYVWLKNSKDEKILNSFRFKSEPLIGKPFGFLNIMKTEYKDNKKHVWVQANVGDFGVGVKSISLTESYNPIVFENINIIQNKKIIKKFEYDKTNNNIITYKCNLLDAVGEASVEFNTSVNLSDVY